MPEPSLARRNQPAPTPAPTVSRPHDLDEIDADRLAHDAKAGSEAASARTPTAFGPAFGQDFTRVKVHTDPSANEFAREHHATAVTLDSDIYFAAGAYAPHTPSGRDLLRHELAHVTQHVPGAPQRIRRQASTTSTIPAPPFALTNGQLREEIQRVERNPARRSGAGAGDSRYASLIEERDRRVKAGQAWLLDDGAGNDLLQVAGGGETARIIRPASDPRTAGAVESPPTFTPKQLRNQVDRQGIRPVLVPDLGIVNGLSAVPTPSLTPMITRRFYPFLRPLTAQEAAIVAQRGAVHLTRMPNLPGIAQADGSVSIAASQGIDKNLTDPSFRPGAYFFAGDVEEGVRRRLNLAGRGARNEHWAIQVQGQDLPPDTLFRPLDGVLSVPGGYRGPGRVFRPGEPVPPGDGIPLPMGSPGTMADALRSNGGTFSGHPLAAGAGAGLLAIVFETGVVLVETGQRPDGADLVRTGLSAGTGGVAGATAEGFAARAIAGELGANTSRVLIVLGRGGAGALGGAIAGPVATIGGMLLDPEEHTGTDYAARGTRSAVDGLASGLLAAGATGALAGSVAPGIGTAVGFLVGVGAYLLTDWLVGDAVESEVRDIAR